MTQRMVYVVIVAMTLWDFEPKIRYAGGRERELIRWSVGYKVVYPAPGQANALAKHEDVWDFAQEQFKEVKVQGSQGSNYVIIFASIT
ncbi:hypothetical protein HBI70_018680 [Parastagonospora nodorum]|nr:hypothetical protein HBI80_022320 [Parastagonospora nodorum]KAH5287366.1 hypothetical protein HBI70_018680 [Parastagonospora nodorum]KAH5991254.1 hypothetical protein HBI82_192260 [Parastagonospora nodorum]